MKFRERFNENGLNLKEAKKGIPGKDRGKFSYFSKGELKKLEFYPEEEDNTWYVFDTEKGFNWTGGAGSESEAQEQADDLTDDLKKHLKN